MKTSIYREKWGEYAETIAGMRLGQVIELPEDAYQKIYHSALGIGRRISKRRIEGKPGFIACKRTR